MTGPVLVTGAAGFVGSHLLELLSQSGVEIVGWRRPIGPPVYPVEGVAWKDVELLDRDAVAQAVLDIQPSSVYHMAGSAHVGQSWQYVRETYEGNVLATFYLFDALRQLDNRPRVLLPCSAHVYAPQSRPIREDDELRPASPYAMSKLAAEMLGAHVAVEDGIEAIVARAFNHVGPRQDPSFVAAGIARQIALIEDGRQDPVITMGSLTPMRDLTDVRDTVRAYVALMAHAEPAMPYNVSSGRAVAVGDLVHAFLDLAQRDIQVVEDPARFRPNDPPLLVGDHSRLTAATGWEPKIPLAQTVADLLDYWRARVKTEA
jgi:GDP-4-dehydro-6-deoxy-D-mannose reductase